MTAAQQLTLPHVPSQPGLSRLDREAQARATYRAAYGMARRIIRDDGRHAPATRWNWYLLHARRRFTTPAAWPTPRPPARPVSDRRTATHARTGSAAELHRQGLVTTTRRVCEGSALAVVPTRGVAVERFVGALLVW